MKVCYSSLNIYADEAQFQEISDLLGLEHQDGFYYWSHLVVEKEDSSSTFISDMMDKIEEHAAGLAKMGVARNDIALHLHYEYDSQMNMEFAPESLYLLGQNGVTLTATCQEVEFADDEQEA